MALVSGSFLSGISGRLGGSEFAMTRAGIVVRPAKRAGKPPTPGQALQRNRFGATGRAWAALTSAQRKSFVTAASDTKTMNRLGIRRAVSGFQLFVGQQPDWTYLGAYPLPNPVPNITSPQPYQVSATFSASGSYFVSQVGVHDPYRYYWRQLYLARYVRDVSGVTARNWTKIGDFGWGNFGITITSICHGLGIYLVEGERVAVRMVPWGYGMAKGAPVVYTAVVTA